MTAEPPLWIDRTGVTHQLRSIQDLSTAERAQLDILDQQLRYTLDLLDAGIKAPAIAQAPPTMERMILRILLPSVAEQEVETFDSTTGHELLVHWWAIAEATR